MDKRLAVVLLLLVGCGEPIEPAAQVAPTLAASKKPDPEIPREEAVKRKQLDDLRATVDTIRADDSTLMRKMKDVRPGISQQEVLDLLGEPSRQDIGEWFYSVSPLTWIDESIKLRGYTITFEDGRVVTTETHSDHYTYSGPGH